MKRLQPYAPAAVVVRILLLELLGDELHLSLGLLEGDTLLEAADHAKIPISPRGLIASPASHGKPKLHLLGVGEILRHDAHDLERVSVDGHDSADGTGIPTEFSLPEAVTETTTFGPPSISSSGAKVLP